MSVHLFPSLSDLLFEFQRQTFSPLKISECTPSFLRVVVRCLEEWDRK